MHNGGHEIVRTLLQQLLAYVMFFCPLQALALVLYFSTSSMGWLTNLICSEWP